MKYAIPEKTIAELEPVFEKLRKVAQEFQVDLKWVEEKGTIYFYPLLPPEPYPPPKPAPFWTNN